MEILTVFLISVTSALGFVALGLAVLVIGADRHRPARQGMKARQKVTWMAFVLVATTLGAASGQSLMAAATVTVSQPMQTNRRLPTAPSDPAVSVSAQVASTVEYQAGHLSVSVETMPLAQLLQEVARQTGLEIRGLESLRVDVSARFSALPLLEGLRSLLASVNYVLITEPSPQGGTQITRVLIFGWETAPSPEASPRAEEPKPVGVIAAQEEQRRAIAALVADADPGLRRWAVERLGEQGDAQAFTRLLETLEDEDAGVRQEALAGLSQYGGAAVGPVQDLLHREEDLEVRVAALQLLGQVGQGIAETAAVLRGVLADHDPRIRIAVVEALGSAGGPGATEALLAAARDVDPGVRMAALRTLALYVGDTTAKGAVEQRLDKDEDEVVQAQAAELLATFTEGKSMGKEGNPDK